MNHPRFPHADEGIARIATLSVLDSTPQGQGRTPAPSGGKVAEHRLRDLAVGTGLSPDTWAKMATNHSAARPQAADRRSRIALDGIFGAS